jgi:GNAT superfamily N-acetyltransferase
MEPTALSVVGRTTIRPATPADSAAIQALNRDSLGYDYPLADTAARLARVLSDPSQCIYVADVEGHVAGYIHGADYICTYADPLKNVLALAVDETWRGRGIGRLLLGTLEDWARACGCAGVRLSSGADRQGAHRFYAACGYILRKEQKSFFKRLGVAP